MIIDGAKIEFGLLLDDTIATDNITASATNESEFSDVNDTLNTDEKQKIAYLEGNYWLLDGSFVMPSDDDIAGAGNVNNIAPDPSFEDNAWQSDTNAFSPYENRWSINVTRSTEHALIGSYSKKIEFSYSGGSRIGTSVYAHARARVRRVFDFVAGNKYYVRCMFSEEGQEHLQSGSNQYINSIVGGAKLGQDAKYISGLVDCVNYPTTSEIQVGMDVYFRTGYDTREVYSIWFDDLLIVNLTEKYGVGKEPSIDVCDRIFNGNKNIVIGYEGAQTNSSSKLSYSFQNTHDSYGITLKFPPTSIPNRISISYYNGTRQIGSTITCPDPYSPYLEILKETYTNEETRLQWNRVEIEIDSFNKGQRPRLQKVVFGTNDSYSEDELIEVSANKTLNVLADYSENGQMSFSIFNDGRYDIKTIKDLSQRVFEELKTRLYVRKHLQSTYELWGTYYVESGKVEENGHIISFTAHDGLYRLDDVTYDRGRVYEAGRSLAEWARDVATVANVEIIISNDFESIMSTGYIPEVPCREAFRLIAEAGHGIFGIDENDVLHIWTYEEKVIDSGGIDDTRIVLGSLSLDNPDKIMGIRVTKYAFTKGDVPSEIGKVEGATLTEGGEKMVVDFSDIPVDPDSVEVNAISGTVSNIQVFSGKASFVLSGEEGEHGMVSIMGIPYTVTESVIERGDTKKNVKEVKENYLITEGIGDNVADYQNIHAIKKYNYSAEVFKTEDVNVGNSYDIEGNRVIVSSDGFSLSYGDYSEDIQGVDE